MNGSIFLPILFILINFNCQTRGQDNPPDNIIPEIYVVKIYTEFRLTPPRYSGNVEITVKCVKATHEIILDVKELEIYDPKSNVEVGLLGVNQDIIDSPKIGNVIHKKENEKLIIIMKKKLEVGNQYKVKIAFGKHLSPDFQQSAEPRKKTDPNYGTNLEKFVISNIGNSKRNVFPCFDRENLKAKFHVYIAYRPKWNKDFAQTEVITMSNMLLMKTSVDNYWITDEYPLSPPMSINDLIIALVIYKLPDDKTVRTISEIKYTMSIKAVNSHVEFALKVAAQCVMFYSQFFDSAYGLKELDIVALPDFHDPVIHKYGLIILNGKSVLYPNEIDESSKSDVALNLCRILSHQWLGSSTNLSISNDDWMIEGISFFLEASCINEVLSEEKIDYINVISTQRFMTEMKRGISEGYILNTDIASDSTNTLSTEKAYCLVRMMKFILDRDPLGESLRLFVKRQREGKTDLSTIWNSFQETAIKYEGSANGGIFEKVMKSWISNKTNYPIITVIRSKNSNIVRVQQKPFEESTIAGSSAPQDGCFLIPLKYKRKNSNLIFTSNELLECGILEIPIENLEEEEWILFNVDTYVLSVTNYNKENWKLIQKTLLDENEFTLIDEMSRVGLVHDLFHLSRAGFLEYDFIFETLQYLKFEESQSVWMVVQEELRKIRSNLLQTDLYKLYKKYIRDILTHIFEKKKYLAADLPKENAQYSLTRIILDLACTHDVDNCAQLSSEVIKSIVETGNPEVWMLQRNNIPVAVRDLVLCNVIKNKAYDVWQSLPKYYILAYIYPPIKKDLLMAMGCSQSPDILKKYLNWSLEESTLLFKDNIEVFRSLSTNELGYPLMKDFLFQHYGEIESIILPHISSKAADKVPGVKEYLAVLLDATTSDADLQEVTDFINQELKLDRLKEKLKKNFDQARRNINWINNNKDVLTQFFNNSNYVIYTINFFK